MVSYAIVQYNSNIKRACIANFFFLFQKVELLSYSDAEYSEHLLCEGWTRSETDTLFELCHRFDLRWTVIRDRWPSHLTTRSIEDLKERYYNVTNSLKKVHQLLIVIYASPS